MNKKVLEGYELVNLAHNTNIGSKESKFQIHGTNNTSISLNNSIFSKHILAVGSIGSGKTNILYHICKNIIENLNENDVVIFFDPKGDYTEKFFDYKDSYQTGNIDPTKNNVNWNIFEDILQTPTSLVQDTIREISSTIFQKYIDSSQNPSFILGARDLFSALLTIAYREIINHNQNWDNQKFKTYINQLSAEKMKKHISSHSDLNWAISYIKNTESVTTQGYLTNLFMVVQEIFSGSFSQSGDFSIRKFIKEKKVKKLFLKYDVANGMNSKPFYTVMLDLAIKEALSVNDNVKSNVYLILDEFPILPRLNYIDNALNFGRSLGLKIIGSVQNISQINSTYKEELASSIISGFSTIIAFRLFDQISRDIVIQKYGKNLIKRTTSQTIAAKGLTDTITEANVIEDWDLTMLNTGECIISLPVGPPFHFKAILYK